MLVMLAAMMRSFAFPLREIMDAAERVAGGDYTTRVRESGPPPIRSLAGAFNTMTARLGTSDAQRRQLMADVSHELRTPLTIMQGRLEGLLDGVYPRDETHLADVLEETRVLSRLVEDLRTLALSESGALNLQREATDLAILAHEVVRAFAAEAEAKEVTLRAETPADLPLIDVDPVRIREVLTNLVSNALRHTLTGGRVTIAISETMEIRVEDTGPGIPTEELERMFDRFYKGAESRGSGLGLTIARNLVEAHGGEIHATSELGKGTTVSFTLR
jgi:two-component system OmpR family sensor kinase/two-component system sensor histidine kinase BaeS